MEEKELKMLLLREDKNFRNIFESHKKCEEKLEEFKKKGFLTEKERLEEKELKKKKLVLKDKMYYLMDKYKKSFQ